jgi:hypothetical protein
VSDKSGWEERSQQFRDPRWGRQGPVPSPWTQPKKNSALEPLEGCIVWGCWELKRKFPVTQLSDEQLPLGRLRGSAYRSHHISVRPDDVLLVASDGNLEAEDRNGVAFGTERLERLFLDNVSVPLPALAARLQSAVQSTYQQSDDQTLLLIRFRA